MQNHYPWNAEVLVRWLKEELHHHGKQHLEDALKIQKHVLRSWLTTPSPTITLAQIHAIANYRSWPVNQVIDWLEIRPGHLEELANQNLSGTSSRHSWR